MAGAAGVGFGQGNKIPSVCMLSHAQLSATPRTIAHQAPLPMEFSKPKQCWGSPYPTPGNPPDPGIEPMSPTSPALAAGFFTTAPPGKPTLSVLFGVMLEKCLVILPVE